MAESDFSIRLYDSDITDLLNGWSEDIRLPRSTPDHLGVFEGLQQQELIYAISRKNYSKAYGLLRKLTQPLSHQDAIAACLCALPCTEKLMDALLDHCPPIPEFQFLGVGAASSLLGVAARHDKHKMLDLLLRRGADPNGGSTPLTSKTPSEEAFCFSAYLSLERLMKAPDLNVTLTEEMLSAWGHLRVDTDEDAAPLLLWCCQLLYQKLTGRETSPFDPPPIPSQLRLGHALRSENPALAAYVCRTRSLTEEDLADVEAHYTTNHQITLLNDGCYKQLLTLQQQYAEFLTEFLKRRPDTLNRPTIRFAVASTALSLPQPDETLQRWVEQLEDGSILLKELPVSLFQRDRVYSPLAWYPAPGLEETLFPRWEERLGNRLIPTLDVNTDLHPDFLSEGEIRQLLERIRFVGNRSPEKLSLAAGQILFYAPEDLLLKALQPDGLLSQESPRVLLDACHVLPVSRRNLILPHIRKETDYAL